MFDPRLTFVVVSCDKYSDVWEPASFFLQKNWPDRPCEAVLSTERKQPEKPLVFDRVVFSDASDWSGIVLDALEQIHTPYVLFALDDMWLTEPMETQAVLSLLTSMEKRQIGSIHLRAEGIRLRDDPQDPDLLVYEPGAPYRITTGPSLWNTAFLRSVLVRGESAWDFERIGSFRTAAAAMPVLNVKRTLFHFPVNDFGGAVVRGKWMPEAIELARSGGFALDVGSRPVFSRSDRRKNAVKAFVYRLNPKLILTIQNLLFRLRHAGKAS